MAARGKDLSSSGLLESDSRKLHEWRTEAGEGASL